MDEVQRGIERLVQERAKNNMGDISVGPSTESLQPRLDYDPAQDPVVPVQSIE